MPDARFFEAAGPLSLRALAALSGIDLDGPQGEVEIVQAAPLVRADGRSVAFLGDRRYLKDLEATEAAAVFLPHAFADRAPKGVAVVVTPEPQAAWARAAEALHRLRLHEGDAPIHPDAEFEEGVRLAPGVVVGQGARIGRGTVIGANTVIGPGVAIGRDCRIGAGVSIHCALVGDRVTLSAGVVVGEPGFGVAVSRLGLVDVPQLGRVILQDGVSAGACTCIDRGAWDDTVVGENSKFDNMVQIAHNARVGRNCVMAGQAGLSGSVTLGDGVMIGGQAGVADHMKVGAGAKIGGAAGVMREIPAGETWSGFPARPMRDFLRESVWLSKQAQTRTKGED